MGNSGKVNRAEPTDITWIENLPGCVELFQQAGWLAGILQKNKWVQY